MNLKEWKDQYDKTIEILNSLDLPEPLLGEDLWHYQDRVEEQFKNIKLPQEFDGELFNFMNTEEFADYLQQYRNVYIQEEVKYTIWRK